MTKPLMYVKTIQAARPQQGIVILTQIVPHLEKIARRTKGSNARH